MIDNRFKAVLFDLDGVLTPTLILHKAAWKQLFEEALPADVAPYTERDYLTYVDGKPRYDGVAALLESRGIELPWGDREDGPDEQTVCGLGNRKNLEFERLLAEQGIEPYADAVDVVRHLRAADIATAVVSSSRNAREVLEVAGIIQYFDTIVDGNVRAEQGLKGKPAPDTYAYGAQLLGVPVEQAVVVEDALSGVAAGRAGGFGLVVGVDRGVGRQALLDNGADVVVDELVELVGGGSSDDCRKAGAGAGSQGFVDPLDPGRYPIDPWTLTEVGAPTATSGTLFSVANGNVGLRGEAGVERNFGNGTVLGGFHETFHIKHAELAYGFAKIGQVIQEVPDATDFHITVDGVALGEPEEELQSLDMRAGTASVRQVRRDGNGRLVEVTVTRMAALFRPDLVLSSLTVRPLELGGEGTAEIVVSAPLNDHARAIVDSDDPRKANTAVGGGLEEVALGGIAGAEGREIRAWRCANSRLAMAMGVAQLVDGAEAMGTQWSARVEADGAMCVERIVSYQTYPIDPKGVNDGLVVNGEQDPAPLAERCASGLDEALAEGPETLRRAQRAWLDEYWHRSDIEVSAEETGASETVDGARIQQTIHWELFQLAQATAQTRNGVPAKGLSGSGYSGHYFWDTEAFVVPFLTYTEPDKARLALGYRHRMLEAARKRACAMNLAGVLYPWRTINGEEAGAYFPAGSAQYHIDADVAYATAQYASVSDDLDFLAAQGVDILVETARMWADLGYHGADGAFHIDDVTGPDEYTAIVDDNMYTNVMAAFNLESAAAALRTLDERDPEAAQAARARLNVRPGEEEAWAAAAAAMCIPFDEGRGIHKQDARFLEKEVWDFEHDTARPLLLHYHPLNIYRKQVLKQTDVVLALYTRSELFDAAVKKADFDYYDPLTTGDSTLSAASQSILAAEVGYADKAMDYFLQSLFTDIADLHRNTSDGVHLASAGGVWMTLVAGFGGLRDSGRAPSLSPRLPEGWKSMSFHLTVGGSLLKVIVDHTGVDVRRIEGGPVSLIVEGETVTV